MKHRNLRMKYATHFMSDEGEGGNNWRESLDETLAGEKALADFKDINGLAKAYLDTKADVGRSIRLPGPDASEDAITAFNQSLQEKVPGLIPMPKTDDPASMAEFFKRFGTPEEPSKYEPGDVPEPIKESMQDFQKAAFEANLTKDQFKNLSEFIINSHKDAEAEAAARLHDEQDKLKLDWGAALPAKSQAILELLKLTGAPQTLVDKVTAHAMDAESMKWFDGLVTALSGEGSQLNFQGDQDPGAHITPAEAKTQIDEIMAGKEYWDPSSPQQKGLVEKVVKLGKLAAAG